MKYCKKCGSPLDEDSAFCTNCGAKIEAEQASVADTKPAKKSNKRLIIIIISVAAAVLALAGGIVGLTIKSSTVNIEDYLIVDVSFDGSDEYGYANVDFDIDESILDELVTDKTRDEVGDSVVLLWLYGCVKVDLDKENDLSNDEKVTATITVDYDEINSFKFKKKIKGPKSIKKEYKVSGLMTIYEELHRADERYYAENGYDDSYF